MTIHIPTWLLYSLLPFALIALVLSPLYPYVTRNHDGDGLLFWMGKRWIKPIGARKWRRG